MKRGKRPQNKTFVKYCEITKIKKHECKSETHYYKTIICFLFSLFQFCGTENVVHLYIAYLEMRLRKKLGQK